MEPQFKISGSSKTDLENKLESAKIDLSENIPPPPVAWGMIAVNNHHNVTILGTLGNISTIIGKAKAKKTFFTGVAVASAVSGYTVAERYRGYLPSNQNNVLYFDTEQGKYHAQQSVKRICKQVGVDVPSNLHAFGLRPFSPKERVEIISHAIETIDGVGFIVIDGIRDLVNSINDEVEATEVTSLLLKWSQLKNLHIITVLHQNKGDNNARGHIGTELMNKSETVLSVTKSDQDELISIVEAQYCRNMEPDIFAFEINSEGLPIPAENFEIRTASKSKQSKTDSYPLENIFSVLSDYVFKNTEFQQNQHLKSLLQEGYKNTFGKRIANNTISNLIPIMLHEGLIKQEAKYQPYSLGKFGESEIVETSINEPKKSELLF